jgi:hypothetical protein
MAADTCSDVYSYFKEAHSDTDIRPTLPENQTILQTIRPTRPENQTILQTIRPTRTENQTILQKNALNFRATWFLELKFSVRC